MRRWPSPFLFSLVLLCLGCSQDTVVVDRRANEPPRVWLAGAPPEGSTASYRVRMYWGGWDPDGVVRHYEYVITDNDSGVFDPADTVSTAADYKWSSVVAHDSVFVLTADQVADSAGLDDLRPYEFQRSHTFFIRAVDDQGARSVKPAYRSFTSRTLSPTVSIDFPVATGLNAAEVPPITTFRWTGTDYVGDLTETQEPDSVRHILVPTARFDGDWTATLKYIRENPLAPEWSKWRDYKAPGDSGRSWTSPPLDLGRYLFAVQVMDEAGAVSPVFDLDHNLRRILVPSDVSIILTLYNRYIGRVVTTGVNAPATIIDIPAHLTMQFEWSAESSVGLVSGYRYGWDITDVSDDSDWWIPWTPFVGEKAHAPPQAFSSGTHTFDVEVMDVSGFKSRASVTMNIVPMGMERNLLLVDDWREAGTCFAANGGVLPCDVEHDAFWLEVLSGVDGFLPSLDVLDLGEGASVTLHTLAGYQNVIWSAVGSQSLDFSSRLAEIIGFRDPRLPHYGGVIEANVVALYMAAGGRVLLCGGQLMTSAIGTRPLATIPVAPDFPFVFRYDFSGPRGPGIGEESFAYDECCLNVLDQSYVQNPNQIRHSCGDLQIVNVRDHDPRNDGLRSALPLDRTTGGGFPPLDLRPEVAGDSGKFYHEDNAGLTCDIYNPEYLNADAWCEVFTGPRRFCFQPIYGNGCRSRTSVVFNAPVAFWSSRFSHVTPPRGIAARSAVWGFDPVYFEPGQVKRALGIILHDEWKLARKAALSD